MEFMSKEKIKETDKGSENARCRKNVAASKVKREKTVEREVSLQRLLDRGGEVIHLSHAACAPAMKAGDCLRVGERSDRIVTEASRKTPRKTTPFRDRPR